MKKLIAMICMLLLGITLGARNSGNVKPTRTPMIIVQYYVYPHKQSLRSVINAAKSIGETISEAKRNLKTQKETANEDTIPGETKDTILKETNSRGKQSDEITLVVSGEGSTKEAATASALRSAIEQAFGTFVSANTTILNDELVRDEIATVSSGNIKSYQELSDVRNEDGSHYVSVSAVVSVGRLISYAQSHGSSTEFAGQTFAMNIKMRELNKQNEKAALKDMIAQLERIQDELFDFDIQVGDPKQKKNSNSEWMVPITVTLTPNENMELLCNIVSNTLASLSLSPEERAAYDSNETKYTPLHFRLQYGITDVIKEDYYLRNEKNDIMFAAQMIMSVLDNARNAFEVVAICGNEQNEVHNRKLDKAGFSFEYYDRQSVSFSITNEFFAPIVINGEFTMEALGKIQGFEVVKMSGIESGMKYYISILDKLEIPYTVKPGAIRMPIDSRAWGGDIRYNNVFIDVYRGNVLYFSRPDSNGTYYTDDNFIYEIAVLSNGIAFRIGRLWKIFFKNGNNLWYSDKDNIAGIAGDYILLR